MRTALVIGALILLAGCDDSSKRAAHMQKILNECTEGTASLEYRVGTFADALTARCEWVKAKEPK